MPLDLDTTVTVTELQTGAAKVGAAVLAVTVTDSRPYLSAKKVQYEIDWGDGSAGYESTAANSPVGPIKHQHVYAVGTYTLTVTAVNFRSPAPDSVTVVHEVTAGSLEPVLTVEPLIFGPVLPRDAGFPSPSDWEFNRGQDNDLLRSSAKLLLTTAVGERLMRPDYGTRLRGLIFDPSDGFTRDAVQSEITRAFAEHEPRLAVVDVSVAGVGTRAVTVDVKFQSRLDNRTIALSAAFLTTA